MWLYLIIFFVPVLAYFLFDSKLSHSVKFLAIIMALLALFVGLSDMLGGYDRYIYGELFDMLADDMRKGWNPAEAFIFEQYNGEWGYNWLNVLIAQFTANRYIFIFIITLIIYSLLFVSFKRYMEDYPFAVILFMALWFFFTFTYLRQVLAASIGYLSIKYIIKRNPWKFALVIVLAYLMHNSAIILVPFYFLPAKKFSVWSILVVMIICFVVGASGVTVGLYGTFGDVANAQARVSKYDIEGSFRIAYFLEALFFLFFIFRSYDKIDANDRKNVVLMNMAFCFCAILLFFIRSENGGRLSWFYLLGVIATLTYLVSKSGKNSLIAVVLVVLSLFLYFRIYNEWQKYLNLYPYKTFLTNGHRYGDYSWEYYEYDHNYDIDKLYR